MLTRYKKGDIIKLVIQSNGVGLVCPVAEKTVKKPLKNGVKAFKIKGFGGFGVHNKLF